MEHKTLNTVIHAAFRRDLGRFDAALDADDGALADRLGVAWDNFAAQLRQHHEDEETIFWPAFRELGFDPVIAAELDSEHQRMVDALREADARMQAYRAAPSATSAATARNAVVELGRVLTNHLEHEEHDLEPWAAQQHDTPQLQACAKAVRKAHQHGAGTFFAWLSDGAGPEETAMMKRQMPAPVLWGLTTFGGRGYRKRIASTWA
ncbi:hemerythrin domain-containing protein [Marmoricola sp. RAF53]|uniref:hemerythrin domain-containing protein n=1 Tax=Marmoricola sp. RAF53 TaxID=3233059 RepID=UPI003F9E0DDB